MRPRLRSWVRLLESFTYPCVLKPDGLPSPGLCMGVLRPLSFVLRDSRFRDCSCLRARCTRSVALHPIRGHCTRSDRV